MTMATVKTNAIRLAIYKFVQLKQVGKLLPLRWAGMIRDFCASASVNNSGHAVLHDYQQDQRPFSPDK
jgi:hypothetical protein